MVSNICHKASMKQLACTHLQNQRNSAVQHMQTGPPEEESCSEMSRNR